MTHKMYNAALLHFKSKRAEAIAGLEIYLQRPSGVADHSNFLRDIIQLTEQLSSAEECISSLEKYSEDLCGENILK